MHAEKEFLIDTNVDDIMKSAYIDYSMSVIVSRALPDVRDGLKPVHRRILYAMLREGLLHNRPFDKCAGIVGEVLKNYHPHGDSSVYEALVRMAQGWVMRYPLVDPQGNFGSIDGDSAAAYRYTECRLKDVAEELLKDIDEDTVDFTANYKESTVEPVVLPSALPSLLMNGSTGIAVGMTTNIPPHNLKELLDALFILIDHPEASIEDILKVIQGPDFPTGGTVVGLEGISNYLKTGRGIIHVRGEAHCEDLGNGREQILITEIPYNVNRANLVTKIAELVQQKVLTEISDIRDESDENTRVVIELKRGEVSRVVLNKLFKMTPLESSFGVILLALDRQRPKQMNIREILECFLEHRREVVTRRTHFRLEKAENRLHILEGYKIALDHLDDFVRMIRSSASRDEAKIALTTQFQLSDPQADAILELRLYQLTGLERDRVDAEYLELLKIAEELRAILANDTKLLEVIKDELLILKKRYGNERKTRIIPAESEFRLEDVIANVGCIITVTHNGFIKRTDISSYRSQKRGGKGVVGAGQYDDDFVEHSFTASTHDYILFVMQNGRLYIKKVYEIPEGSRIAKGRALINVLELQRGEKIAAMRCIKDFSDAYSLVMATQKGIVKKTVLSAYRNCRASGLIGMNIDDGDLIIGADITNGNDDLILITYKGMSIRFGETDCRDQGRATRGVRGIRLRDGDCVKALIVVNDHSTLLIAGTKGQGKRSEFSEYRLQQRGGVGVIAIKTHGVAGAIAVDEKDEMMLFTKSGQAVRTPVRDVRVIGRTTMGVRLIHLAKDDTLMGICKVVEIESAEA
ncbi:MAG: DNA gyrase subunit A [Puniceicoccales bacterium]|jgi:DNA gyrase subunit A|nr:DNA gyrase subunit A [Puniceicoccales bacterium]